MEKRIVAPFVEIRATSANIINGKRLSQFAGFKGKNDGPINTVIRHPCSSRPGRSFEPRHVLKIFFFLSLRAFPSTSPLLSHILASAAGFADVSGDELDAVRDVQRFTPFAIMLFAKRNDIPFLVCLAIHLDMRPDFRLAEAQQFGAKFRSILTAEYLPVF
jgi:hypothetical protein